jgi:hypothetical protein
MAEIIINCAADLDLAKALFNYMLSFLNPIDKNVSIELKSDEIYVNYDNDKDLHFSKKDLIDVITSFIKTAKDYGNHQITEFDDNIITIGIPTTSAKLLDNVLTCEMCNYMTPYEKQLRLHRMTHGNVMIG